jgi:hypothetical protein
MASRMKRRLAPPIVSVPQTLLDIKIPREAKKGGVPPKGVGGLNKSSPSDSNTLHDSIRGNGIINTRRKF